MLAALAGHIYDHAQKQNANPLSRPPTFVKAWRLRSFAHWAFRDPKFVWLGIAVPLVALTLAAFPAPSDFRMRMAGYLVTVAGVVLVGVGIASTQRLFGRPAYSVRIIQWAKRLPPIFMRQRVIVATGGISVGATSMSGRGYVRAGPGNGSLSQRLRAAEENIKRIDDRITATERRIDGGFRAVRASVQAEATERDRRLVQVSQRLEEYSAGSLDLEVVGAAWVLLGQALSSFPAEIAGFVLRWRSI